MTARKKKAGQLKITQIRSGIGCKENHKRILAGLGLGKIGRTVVRPDEPCTRGMVAKIPHLVSVEEVEG